MTWNSIFIINIQLWKSFFTCITAWKVSMQTPRNMLRVDNIFHKYTSYYKTLNILTKSLVGILIRCFIHSFWCNITSSVKEIITWDRIVIKHHDSVRSAKIIWRIILIHTYSINKALITADIQSIFIIIKKKKLRHDSPIIYTIQT